MKKAKTKDTRKRTVRNDRASVVSQSENGDELLDDYSFLDWGKAERGKYAKRYAKGTNVVLIAPDVLDVFPNAESINHALRTLADLIRASSTPKPARRAARRSK